MMCSSVGAGIRKAQARVDGYLHESRVEASLLMMANGSLAGNREDPRILKHPIAVPIPYDCLSYSTVPLVTDIYMIPHAL